MTDTPVQASDLRETWIIIRDDGWRGPPSFKAAKFVKQSKSRVYYSDRWESDRFVSEEKVAAFGLSEADAKRAVEQLTSSRDLQAQERKASEQRCAERAAKIIADLQRVSQ